MNRNLVLKINDPNNASATDQITIEIWDTGIFRIEQVQFDNGTVWTAANLTSLSMMGTSGADNMTLWDDSTLASGGAGNDTISSSSSNAVIYGDDGDDTITDSGGSDTIDGGTGNDVITDGGSGTNVLRGGDGNDTITYDYTSNNTVEGGAGNDLIKVSSQNTGGYNTFTDTLRGGNGR